MGSVLTNFFMFLFDPKNSEWGILLLVLAVAAAVVAIGFWQMIRISKNPPPPVPTWREVCSERDPVRREAMSDAIKEANKQNMRIIYIAIAILGILFFLWAIFSPLTDSKDTKTPRTLYIFVLI